MPKAFHLNGYIVIELREAWGSRRIKLFIIFTHCNSNVPKVVNAAFYFKKQFKIGEKVYEINAKEKKINFHYFYHYFKKEDKPL